MSIIIDLIIVGVIALCIIMGYVKGLTGSLIKILSFVLSLVIAFILFVPVSNFVIENTQIDEMIMENIVEIVMGEKLAANDEQVEKNETMPTAITDYINQKIEEAADEAKESVVDSTAQEVSLTIVKAGTWIVLFILARIALTLLKLITSLIAKLPVIKQFDKLGGIIYGLIEGLIITYFALALISCITPMTKGTLSENINKSYIGSQMYNNNLLLNIIF